MEAVECKSISAAAKRLYITQSALSQAIAAFETEIGAELLIRSNQGISPTLLGRTIYADAQKLKQEIESLKGKWTALADEAGSLSGEVKIVTVPSANHILMEYIVPEVHITYPNIEVTIFEQLFKYDSESHKLPHDADIGIGACIHMEFPDLIENTKKAGMEIKTIGDDTQYLWVSVKNPLAKLDTVTEKDLESVSVACYSGEPVPPYAKYFNRSSIYRLQNKSTIMRYVMDGYAAAVFTHYIKNSADLKSGKVKAIPIVSDDEEAFPRICQYIIHRKKDRMTLSEKRVLSIIEHYYESNTENM